MRIAPSALRSTRTSGAPSRTVRNGARVASEWVFAEVSVMPLAARDLGAALFQKIVEPPLRFTVALRDRRGQRLGGEAGSGVAAGDARQHMRDGKVGERCIGGDTLRELDGFGEPGAGLDEILREPDRMPLF